MSELKSIRKPRLTGTLLGLAGSYAGYKAGGKFGNNAGRRLVMRATGATIGGGLGAAAGNYLERGSKKRSKDDIKADRSHMLEMAATGMTIGGLRGIQRYAGERLSKKAAKTSIQTTEERYRGGSAMGATLGNIAGQALGHLATSRVKKRGLRTAGNVAAGTLGTYLGSRLGDRLEHGKSDTDNERRNRNLRALGYSTVGLGASALVSKARNNYRKPDIRDDFNKTTKKMKVKPERGDFSKGDSIHMNPPKQLL